MNNRQAVFVLPHRLHYFLSGRALFIMDHYRQADFPGGFVEDEAARRIKNVLFITEWSEGASLRYRVFFPSEALSLYGVRSRVCMYNDPRADAFVDEADAIVIYRIPATRRLLHLIEAARKRRKPILFDIDDLDFDPNVAQEEHPMRSLSAEKARRWLEAARATRTAVEVCDAFIGSTEPLIEYAMRLTGVPARTFPNGISHRMVQAADAALQQRRGEVPLRIGYLSGSPTHNADWSSIEPAVLDVMARFEGVELWLIGDISLTPALRCVGGRVKAVPYQPWINLPQFIRSLAVNLAPLVLHNQFNEAKSPIKWSEAALVCTPTIASATRPYQAAITHNINGFLAESVEDWRQSLTLLLDDAGTRERIGTQARRDVLSPLSPQEQGRRYLDILAWATQLSEQRGRGRSSTDALFVVNECDEQHLLEPYPLALLSRRIEAKRVTTEIRFGSTVQFPLPVTCLGRAQLDLLFATYGDTEAAVKVSLFDSNNERLIDSDTARIITSHRELWIPFKFRVEKSEGDLWVRVERIEYREPTARTGRGRGKIALWAQADGAHVSKGRRHVGAPCLRVWAQSGASKPIVSDELASGERLAGISSKLRSFDYVWRTKGLAGFHQAVLRRHG